jgi:putative ABC transport system permease protein
VGIIGFAAVGGLMLFLGVASLSTTVARPVSRFLGAPIAAAFKMPGVLARENAARSPRRTASTASALMIGVALVSTASVFAASLKKTFSDTLKNAVTADYIVTDQSFQGLPVQIAQQMEQLPEFDAVSPVRGTQAQVNGATKAIGAVDANAISKLLDLGMLSGRPEDMADDGILLHRDPARDLRVKVGDSIDVTFLNGVQRRLRVAGIYKDASVVGNWLMSLDTLQAVTSVPPSDFFVVARLANGVAPADGRAALNKIAEGYPQMKVQDQAEFRRQQEGQIDQFLAIITGLLVFAIVIAMLGIAITLALSVFERTREIGLMRAIGMNRRQTRRMVRWESVIVTVFGGVVGVVLGCALGVALSSAVPNTVINSIRIPVTLVIGFLVAAALAGVVAAWYPARKAARMNVLDAIATT